MSDFFNCLSIKIYDMGINMGITMKQNTQIWLAPNENISEPILSPKITQRFNFDQCVDGNFSCEVWLLSSSDADTLLSLSLDDTTLYRSMRVTAQKTPKWSLFGSFLVAKGGHKLEFTNKSAHELKLDGILVTRDNSYIVNGFADKHRQLLLSDFACGIAKIEEEITLNAAKAETAAEKKLRLEHLTNAGFLFSEDQYAADAACRCGVPLGGIGAGKLELDHDGIFTAITINNNQDAPIYKSDGSFFAAWTSVKNKKDARILQKGGHLPSDIPRIEDIDFCGLFPHAELDFKGMPISIKLNAFSALVPNDTKSSSLPGAVFEFTLENPTDEVIDAAVMFSFENLLGTGGSMILESQDEKSPSQKIFNTWSPALTWCNHLGNKQDTYKSKDNAGIIFSTESDHNNPASFGNYTLLCPTHDEHGNDAKISFQKSWNSSDNHCNELFDDFLQDGCLDDSTEFVPSSPLSHTCGALCQKITLKKKARATLTFILTWHTPHLIDASRNDIGTYYSNFFSHSCETAEHIAQNLGMLFEKTVEFEKLILASTLPKWLQHKLINDRFPIYTCSWFAKDGKFAINEAPTGMGACLGTMDQRLACSSLYTNFFPTLDLTELKLFAELQGENGSISHDIGCGEFFKAEKGGTWSDLCSSFVLQIYKYYIYTGDTAFLDEMYPKIKKTVDYQRSIDLDKNGIPDVGYGHGTTYDTYHWYGTSAFVATLWLAQLQACVAIAKQQNDLEFADLCMSLFEQAGKSMQEELWNTKHSFGNYFDNFNDSIGERKSENCFIAQLAGQWFADLMKLGDLLPSDMINSSLKTIGDRNMRLHDIALMNDETTPEGDFSGYGYTFVQYDEVYYGCLAITRGFAEDGLECMHRLYKATKKTPWNIGLTYLTDGRLSGLPYYMTNPASLFVLEALSGWVPDAAQKSIRLGGGFDSRKLSTPQAIPLFSPKLWAWLEYIPHENEVQYKLTILHLIDSARFNAILQEVNGDVSEVLLNSKKVKYTIENNVVKINLQTDVAEGDIFDIVIKSL